MTVEIKVVPADPGDFHRLAAWLSELADVEVTHVERPPAPNAQGTVWDFLSVAVSSGGGAAAVMRALQVWIESRITKVTIEYPGGRIEAEGPHPGDELAKASATVVKMLETDEHRSK